MILVNMHLYMKSSWSCTKSVLGQPEVNELIVPKHPHCRSGGLDLLCDKDWEELTPNSVLCLLSKEILIFSWAGRYVLTLQQAIFTLVLQLKRYIKAGMLFDTSENQLRRETTYAPPFCCVECKPDGGSSGSHLEPSGDVPRMTPQGDRCPVVWHWGHHTIPALDCQQLHFFYIRNFKRV